MEMESNRYIETTLNMERRAAGTPPVPPGVSRTPGVQQRAAPIYFPRGSPGSSESFEVRSCTCLSNFSSVFPFFCSARQRAGITTAELISGERRGNAFLPADRVLLCVRGIEKIERPRLRDPIRRGSLVRRHFGDGWLHAIEDLF